MSQESLPRLLKMYQRFVEISHNLASTLDLTPLLNNIMEVAVELVDAEEASILLYDQHTHRLYFETATNMESSPLLQKLFVPEESIAGWVALNRLPQVINNVDNDDRHFDTIDQKVQFTTRSMIAVPLLAKQKLIGVLEVLNKRSGSFDNEDKEIMLALGEQAAIAIENSRLFQQSDLIAEFVHELRTPMSSLYTASFLLQRPEIATDQRVELAETIHQETQRLNELASIFLDLASLESGRSMVRLATFAPGPMFEECKEIVQKSAAEKLINIHLDISPELPEIFADQEKVKQVILNLLINAVKFNRPHGEIWLRAWADERSLHFSVKDTGVGIPADQMPQLFTRFFRGRNVERTISGTGLGLSICRRVVEMHNGEIEVESELNVGATFTVRLPLTQEES